MLLTYACETFDSTHLFAGDSGIYSLACGFHAESSHVTSCVPVRQDKQELFILSG